jgi:hypothetical protein
MHMKNGITKVLAGAGLVVFLITMAHTPGAHAKEAQAALGPQLSERLRTLLREEMNLIQSGMERALIAIAAGDHQTVYENGRDIYRSFILKQQLTEEDRRELMAVAPAGFIELDGAFHDTAHKLAKAGRDEDPELQAFYFSRLVESCTVCHARHAGDRFPGLSRLGESDSGHHHH